MGFNFFHQKFCIFLKYSLLRIALLFEIVFQNYKHFFVNLDPNSTAMCRLNFVTEVSLVTTNECVVHCLLGFQLTLFGTFCDLCLHGKLWKKLNLFIIDGVVTKLFTQIAQVPLICFLVILLILKWC